MKGNLVYGLLVGHRKRKKCGHIERETGGDKRKYYTLEGILLNTLLKHLLY